MSSCGPRQKPVADSCEQMYDPLCYITCGEFIDQPRIYQCLKTVAAPWVLSIRIRSSEPSRHGFIEADQLFRETCCLSPKGKKDGNTTPPKRWFPPIGFHSFANQQTMKWSVLINWQRTVILNSNSKYTLADTLKLGFLTKEIAF